MSRHQTVQYVAKSIATCKKKIPIQMYNQPKPYLFIFIVKSFLDRF